jgi:hypothetical protein
MRHRRPIQIRFEPGRLSADHLRRAYDLVAPVLQRRARAGAVIHDPQQQRGRSGPQREEKAA